MALYTVTTANTILAADINQLVNVLQRPAGSTETGKYYLIGNGYANLANFGEYQQSLSRNATPVSVSIDTADQSPINNCNSPGTQNLTGSGFLVFATTSAATLNPKVAGNFTIQY